MCQIEHKKILSFVKHLPESMIIAISCSYGQKVESIKRCLETIFNKGGNAGTYTLAGLKKKLELFRQVENQVSPMPTIGVLTQGNNETYEIDTLIDQQGYCDKNKRIELEIESVIKCVNDLYRKIKSILKGKGEDTNFKKTEDDSICDEHVLAHVIVTNVKRTNSLKRQNFGSLYVGEAITSAVVKQLFDCVPRKLDLSIVWPNHRFDLPTRKEIQGYRERSHLYYCICCLADIVKRNINVNVFNEIIEDSDV